MYIPIVNILNFSMEKMCWLGISNSAPHKMMYII